MNAWRKLELVQVVVISPCSDYRCQSWTGIGIFGKCTRNNFNPVICQGIHLLIHVNKYTTQPYLVFVHCVSDNAFKYPVYIPTLFNSFELTDTKQSIIFLVFQVVDHTNRIVRFFHEKACFCIHIEVFCIRLHSIQTIL